jgi:quercetin dioxygenase-like cupin family protein
MPMEYTSSIIGSGLSFKFAGVDMKNDRKRAVASVQIENDRFIVTEWRFAPGAETGWHQHAFDYIVVPQTTGQLRIELDDNNKVMSDLVTGQSYNRSVGVEHNVINANEFEFVFVEIELK